MHAWCRFPRAVGATNHDMTTSVQFLCSLGARARRFQAFVSSQIVVGFKTLKACRGVEDCEPVLHGDAFHLNRLGEYSLLEAFWKYPNNIADFGRRSALA